MKTLIQITRRLNLNRLFILAVLFLSINTLKGQENYYSQLANTDNNKGNASHLSILLTDCSFSDSELNAENEPSDNIESWMMDTGFWSDINEINDDEPEMEFEEWMFDTNLWAEFVENEMEIEAWMLDVNFWNSKATVLLEQEKELEIEHWMSDISYWNINGSLSFYN